MPRPPIKLYYLVTSTSKVLDNHWFTCDGGWQNFKRTKTMRQALRVVRNLGGTAEIDRVYLVGKYKGLDGDDLITESFMKVPDGEFYGPKNPDHNPKILPDWCPLPDMEEDNIIAVKKGVTND